MDFINFESIRDKEAVRQDLREARAELLKRAEIDSKKRAEKHAERELRGENKWLLPAISKKLKKSSKSSKKKKKKESKKSSKKSKKKSKKHDTSSDSSSSDSESDEEPTKKSKKKKSKKSKKRESSSSDSSSSSDADQWVEKSAEAAPPKPTNTTPLVRDDWMTNGDLFLKTYKREKKEIKKKSIDEYNPATSTRELNPHWKNNGDGLPAFQKPADDYDLKAPVTDRNPFKSNSFSTGGWKKRDDRDNTKSDRERDQSNRSRDRYNSNYRSESKPMEKPKSPSSSDHSVEASEEEDDDKPSFLTDEQMNELAAKLIKAEIMGNEKDVNELKKQLEDARAVRAKVKETCSNDEFKARKTKQRKNKEDEHMLLTVTDNQGNVRPFQGSSKDVERNDYRGKQKKRADTHVDGKRVRYFPDDERYDINQMFTRERNIDAMDSDLQFAEIAGKNKNPNDDLEDIFADCIRKNPKDEAKKLEKLAIQQQERMQKILDDCEKCFNTPKMQQNLMVSLGSSVYLSLPWHEGLTPGHCLIVPMQHTTCSTRLDEDVWAEVTEYRNALTQLFAKRKQDVIFFEIARYLNRSPHMVIHCIPCEAEMAPFYFKKAIQESEQEWSTNKQLISLKDKDLRRSVPKGLPYFWVHFGMSSGFAHVIEDQSRFPENYAQEIIGNMLELNPAKWRRPRKEQHSIEKVKQFAEWFKPYDFTNKR